MRTAKYTETEMPDTRPGDSVSVVSTSAPGKRDFGCPGGYDAIDMVAYADVVEAQLGAKEPAEAEPVTT